MNLMDLFIKIELDDRASSKIDGLSQKVGNGLKKAAEIGVAAMATVAAGIAATGKAAIDAYADYEQLVGGIETLFKESAGQVQEYAAEAYKTSGLSANEYMEAVTSFSASLLQDTGRGAQTNLEELENYLESELESAKDTYSEEYDARKTTLDAEYNAIKEAYDAEYEAAQNAYDVQYQALKDAQAAEIKAYTETADAKIAAIDKSNKEAVAAAKQEKKDTIATMKESNKQALTALKEGQNKELAALKSGYKKKLADQKTANSNELKELKNSNAEKLEAQKAAIKDQVNAAEEANMVSVTTLESQAKAAELANQAIIDMSDNANKMGTDMTLIQNAYQGFAKANYTMLDNLKLGYGGTKTEMERLIADAAKLSDTVDAQSLSFANVVEAVHVVQTELGITGTTAKEAGATISGSINSMKAAYKNLVTGIADENADIGALFDDLVVTIVGDGTDSNKGVLGNLLPRVKQTFNGMVTLAKEIAPTLLPYFADGIINEENLGKLWTAAENIVGNLSSFIQDNEIVGKLSDSAVGLINGLKDFLSDDKKLETLVGGAVSIVTELADDISENAGEVAGSALDLLSELCKAFVTEDNLKKLTEGAIDIVKNIGSSISDNAFEIGEGVGDLIAHIKGLFEIEDWSALGESIVTDIGSGIKTGLTNFGSVIESSLYALSGTVSDALGADALAEEDFMNAAAAWENTGAFGDFIEGLHEGLFPYEPTPMPEGFDASKSALYGGYTPGAWSKSYRDMQSDFENALGDISYSDSAIGKSSSAIANSFVGSGVPAGESVQVNLNVDGEELASVIYDPLDKIARQKG